MAVSKIYSAQTNHLKAQIIDIEVDLSKGLHSFSIVGLGDTSVNESKDRVSSAIKNSGFKSPKNKNQKIIVSLAPADIKKEGSFFDLPIALAYLIASEDIRASIEKSLFVGELSLDGVLRPMKGALPITQKAKLEGFTEIFLPIENVAEAGAIPDIKIFGAHTLLEVIEHINTKEPKDDEVNIRKKLILSYKKIEQKNKKREIEIDFADVKGQESAKRGLEIAGAGGHNIMMFGPPGTGKTMLARAFQHILPPLSFDDSLDVTSIYSVSGELNETLIKEPPFRSPHHTASYVSLVGGGSNMKPGEITLAHKGILFMDEFPEFDTKVLETLRQPLEDRFITISRAKGSVKYPAHFILVATMNPCPCGNYGIRGKECSCSAKDLDRYKKKLSGPIVDRIDLWVEVSKVDHEKLTESSKNESLTEKIQKNIAKAREIQEERYSKLGLKNKLNSEISSKHIVEHIFLSEKVKNILNMSAKQLDLSARSYHRVIKIARTIADLENAKEIQEHHILEALQYRPKKYQTG